MRVADLVAKLLQLHPDQARDRLKELQRGMGSLADADPREQAALLRPTTDTVCGGRVPTERGWPPSTTRRCVVGPAPTPSRACRRRGRS
eukprot:gene22063-22588_t